MWNVKFFLLCYNSSSHCQSQNKEKQTYPAKQKECEQAMFILYPSSPIYISCLLVRKNSNRRNHPPLFKNQEQKQLYSHGWISSPLVMWAAWAW